MWQPAFATLLLVGQVSASVISNVGIVRRDNSMEKTMRRYVDARIEPVQRRQSNVTEWDAQTMAACTTALETLNGKASNDAGMAVCYNLPFLDNSTGVFQADLRLYMISPPTGQFASISSQNVMVGLSYVGATVSAVNASTLGARSEEAVSLISWPRNAKRQAQAPTMIQAYAFVGQINKDLLGPSMTTWVLLASSYRSKLTILVLCSRKPSFQLSR